MVTKDINENITISVENYGPIAKAKDIELRPLTIFSGPSNTGKSYLAILTYALHKTLNFYDDYPLFFQIIRRGKILSYDSLKESFVEKFVAFINELENYDITFSTLPKDIQNTIKKTLALEINNLFYEEIARCLGINNEDDLINDDFKLKFKARNIELFFSQKNQRTIKISEKFSKEIIQLGYYARKSRKIGFPSKENEQINRYDMLMVSEFLGDIQNKLFDNLTEITPYYLPAARTGIMQSHQVIVSTLIKRLTSAGLEKFSVPTLSGVNADFLQEIISLGQRGDLREEHFPDIAGKMEKNILYGSIEVRESEINSYPQFFYRDNEIEVPLMRSSSMVSELAPIILFLRDCIQEGNLLIIEEPEAHLHPGAQRQIAETIVELIRAGVRVMVTTHSDYFLEQISNHIRLEKMKDSDKEDSKPILYEKEVAAYSFSPNDKGTFVSRLEFDQETGLSPEDHNKVSSDLYNETVDILEKTTN